MYLFCIYFIYDLYVLKNSFHKANNYMIGIYYTNFKKHKDNEKNHAIFYYKYEILFSVQKSEFM